MAMGQRGMYLAVSLLMVIWASLILFQMLAHSGMIDIADSALDIEKCKQDPENAWEEWKEQESRHR